MLGLKNRGSLGSIIEDEFENIVAQFRALFLTEHNEDGSHRAPSEVTNYVPSGGILPYAGSTAPTHWLICDGSQVNRVAYARLFGVIGVTYGVGDGSTTFNLPDLRGKFLLSKSASGTGSTLAATGGALDHTHSGGSHTHAAGTLAVDSHTHSTPAHAHTVSGTTAAEASHTHSYSGTTSGGTDLGAPTVSQYDTGSTTNHSHTYSGTTGAGSSHTHAVGSLAADSGGSGTSGSTAPGLSGSTASTSAGTTGAGNPAYIVLNHIIKT